MNASKLQRLNITIIPVLAFLGFIDSVYLTVQHYAGVVPPCDVTHACETVLTSQYATVGPLPIATFGIGYFLVIMILAILYLQQKQRKTLQVLFALSGLAFISALGLLYIQAFLLHAFCQYCLFAEAMMTLIFVLSCFLILRAKRQRSREVQVLHKVEQ
jgi:uncharacterized membrane protein